MSLEIYKYQGLGNDFILLDRRGPGLPPRPGEWAEALCDRRLGVGGDGVLYLLEPTSAEAEARMRIFNSDGSEAEMCGNGLRCLALHMRETLGLGSSFGVQTEAGLRFCALGETDWGGVADVTVDMGAPSWDRPTIPMKGKGEPIRRSIDTSLGERIFTALSMGNPHMIIFQPTEAGEPAGGSTAVREEALALGPELEVHDAFPERVNVSVVSRREEGVFDAAVWERGCGLTAACGTGACAIGVAACLEERAAPGEELEVRLPGGSLVVSVAPGFENVRMRGPAALSFVGRVSLERLERSRQT
jgi:diaminopimelate epimerase